MTLLSTVVLVRLVGGAEADDEDNRDANEVADGFVAVAVVALVVVDDSEVMLYDFPVSKKSLGGQHYSIYLKLKMMKITWLLKLELQLLGKGLLLVKIAVCLKMVVLNKI